MYNDELIESSKIKWQSFLKGDDDAYAWLYSRYVQQLYQYGCRFTTDTEMVKDCVQDVFVNVVGGVKVGETGADLALLLALISSFRNRPLPQDLVVFGEVGLAGEIRPVTSGQERISEAAKHGFKRAIVPFANKPKSAVENMEVFTVKKLADALAILDNF